jgi:ribosomal protein S18 acetylase RimI-like enzyme
VSSPAVTLRPSENADSDFLVALYATTREDELQQVDWTPEQKAAFVHSQFWTQHRHWRENYSDTRWEVIVRDSEPIGRLYVARWPDEIRIVDISVMPQHRNAGIGTRLIRGLLAEGHSTGRKVSIHVEMDNPARRLYERLGFVQAGEHGVYLRMERPCFSKVDWTAKGGCQPFPPL